MLSDSASVVLSRIYWRSVNVIALERLQTTKCGFGPRSWETLGWCAWKSGIWHDGVSTISSASRTSRLPQPRFHFGGLAWAKLEWNLAKEELDWGEDWGFAREGRRRSRSRRERAWRVDCIISEVVAMSIINSVMTTRRTQPPCRLRYQPLQ